ncbi:MAG: TlpA disulfide reductase family protein [bacterium]|nr:TlpA disulfide reductase family protein [bacterium]
MIFCGRLLCIFQWVLAALLVLGLVVACGNNDDSAVLTEPPTATELSATPTPTVATEPPAITEPPATPITAVATETAPVRFAGYQAGQLIALLEGQPVPAISGTTISGHPFEWVPGLAPTVIVFLAHWCPACQNEIAEFSRWLNEGNSLPEGVDFFGVSTLVNSERGNYPPSRWLADARWPYTVLADDTQSTVANTFGLTGTPFWAVIDSNGLLVSRNSGQVSPESLAMLFEQLTA